jgi:F420-0:gamma-glutamyl ligase
MKLLSPESLAADQWAVLRDTPYLVVLAVSAAGGTRLDALLERAAGAKAIANGKNNDHPLIRLIAKESEMESVIAAMYARFAGPAGPKYSPAQIKELAVQSAREAFAVLHSLGGELDFYAYRTFVAGVARAVAEAAREGDVMGIGGQLVSDAERAVIQAVGNALNPAASASAS